jgi:NAD(P)H-hydrate repair Nnr-like enzyme with NAD(P)H-hydrate epimerase domain
MLEPLYTADEMRAAEERYPGSEDELMERAGRAVAAEVLRRWPDAGAARPPVVRSASSATANRAPMRATLVRAPS